MEGSLLEALGLEIIGVMAPVSICMLLVVLLVFNIDSQTSQAPITSVATLVYSEDSSDTNVQKFGGAILNALVFVVLISIVTFLLVLLYYYRCTNFLKNYIRFSTFVILASMGGSICLSIIQQFSIPVDAITCFVLLYNFSVVGVLSVFSGGIPIFVRQVYMVLLGIIVAAWFTKLPEWTTWVVLVALALYDLVAVLSPVGPLKLLVELASTRDEELPALVYEARPTVSRREDSAMNMLVGGVSASVLMTDSNSRLEAQPQVVELQAINRNRNQDSVRGEEQVVEIDPYSENLDSDRRGERSRTTEFGESSSHGRETNRTDEETTPLVSHIGFGVDDERPGIIDDMADHSSRGIKLGLGDFVFYSVLVGRAAMYDLMTVYACYIAVVSGLGCTLILLSVCHHALPALPISIALGVTFYFLTRLLMEPFVVGTSTNLVMF